MLSLGPTSFAAKGGCSCKVPAPVVTAIRADGAVAAVSGGGDDDAAFLPIEGVPGLTLVASVDFQTPLVDDWRDSARIAATNALSDLYASGVVPEYALVSLVLPWVLPLEETGAEIMGGIADACRETGRCRIVGGHTISGPTAIIGLTVFSVTTDTRIKTKGGAKPGDQVFLTKPLGSGIAITAWQLGLLSSDHFEAALATVRRLNSVGAVLGEEAGVTALTDVTGFGLIGHASEVAKASGVTLTLDYGKMPILHGISAAAREGAVPDLAASNLRDNEGLVDFQGDWSEHERLIVADPQTNGGLLVCADRTAAARVAAIIAEAGLEPSLIGSVGEPVTGVLLRLLR